MWGIGGRSGVDLGDRGRSGVDLGRSGGSGGSGGNCGTTGITLYCDIHKEAFFRAFFFFSFLEPI